MISPNTKKVSEEIPRGSTNTTKMLRIFLSNESIDFPINLVIIKNLSHKYYFQSVGSFLCSVHAWLLHIKIYQNIPLYYVGTNKT